MNKKHLFGGILAAAALLCGCTDAQRAKTFALGDPARATCFSGGRLIFDDFSTGKVNNEEHSDGYYFVSRTTHRLASTSGDCQLDYNAEVPQNFTAIHRGEPVGQPTR